MESTARELARSRPKRILHDRGVRSNVHADVQDRHCHGKIEMASNPVCRVQRVLAHRQINIVRRLNVIAHETWISRVTSR